MKKFIWGVMVFILSTHTYSQTLTQTIKGQITDEQSGTPLIGATVRVAGISPPLGAVSDVNGYYRIEEVPIGRQSIYVSYLGYSSATIPEILVSTGKEAVINVKLIESLQQLDEVVISAEAQKKGEPRNDLATVSAISLGVEETSRFAATFDDPARAALTYAGVQTGGDDLLNEIVIRGNSPKGILWRLEGVEIPNPNHFTSIGSSAGGISMLSSSVLASSDFFTGAFPAQYGNATSGIFDLQLRQGNFDKHEHAIQAGLLGIAAASEGPIAKGSRSSYLVNYRYSTLSLLTNLGLDILGDEEDIAFQDLSFKIRLPTKKVGSFSIWGLGGRNTYDFNPNRAFGDFLVESEDQTLGVGGVTNVFYTSDDSFFETIISGSFSKLTNNSDSLNVKLFQNEDFVETSLRFSTFYNHKFSARHALRVGAVISRLGYDLENQFLIRSENRYITTLDENDHAEFLQGFSNWQFRPSDKLTINSGIHISHFALNNRTYVEPRMGFRWNREKYSITGGAGLHSRMETVALYTAKQQLESGGFVQNNKDLGFTRAAHVALGFEKMLMDGLKFKSEVYYQHLYDVPVWPNDTASSAEALSFSILNTFDGYTSTELANDGTGRNYGLELTLERFLTNGFYMLSTASFYKSLYTAADGVERSTQFDGGYIFNFLAGKEIPVGKNGNNTLGLNGKFIFAGGKRQAPLDIIRSINEGGSRFNFERNYELKLDNFFRMDIGISYRKNKPRLTSVIALNIQNLTQRSNEFFRFYDPGSGQIRSDSQVSFFPNLSYRIEF
ncbi:MAG: TonB-dependent receptor [Ekhidna sp.]